MDSIYVSKRRTQVPPFPQNKQSPEQKEYFDYLNAHDLGWQKANELQKEKEHFFTQLKIWDNEVPAGETFYNVNRSIATNLDLAPTKHPTWIKYDLSGANHKPIALNPFH